MPSDEYDPNDSRMPEPSDILSRRSFPPVTIILLIINVLVFLRTDLFHPLNQESSWIAWGACSWQGFFQDHEYYRLLTSMFLHLNTEHITGNMISLIFVGNYLEQHIGSRRFLSLYFTSGILADFASMVYNMMRNANVISVGASGALYGITGGLLVYAFLHRGESDNLNVRQLIFAIILSLAGGGRTFDNIDHSAHIGGFLSGMLLMPLLNHGKARRHNKDANYR